MSQPARKPNLAPEISMKRQAISIILISGLVFGAFWSMSGIFDLVTGGSRGGYQAQQDLNQNQGGTFGLYEISTPEFPDINLNDTNWEDLLDNLDPEDLQDLMDMLGGNLDQIDPDLLASLMGSDPEALDTVMFRVLGANLADVQGELFRYSVFDSFSDSDWSKNFPGEIPDSYQENWEYYSASPDVTQQYNIQIPLGSVDANVENSAVVPGVSPTTSIRGDIFANPGLLYGASVNVPYIDEYGVKSLRPVFGDSVAQNLSFYTWGFQRASGDYFYNTTTRADPSIIDTTIRSRFLTFPAGVTASTYAAARPGFAAVVADIQARMNTNPSANLFVKANMIRNYIQWNFAVDTTIGSSAADIVEDVCQNRIGDFYALTSTFVMLARYFQIPARFVMGYSGHLASAAGGDVEIKLLNTYAWAEVFMPVADDGSGEWVPVDVLQVSYSDGVDDGMSGGNPIGSELPDNTELLIYVNGTQPNAFSLYYTSRPSTVNITVNVTLSGTAFEGPVSIFDMLEETTIVTIATDSQGRGQFLWNVNTSVLAGLHIIRVSAGSILNYSGVAVNGNVNLTLLSRTPDLLNRTSSTLDLHVEGYLEDTGYTGTRTNNHIPKANITVGLYTLSMSGVSNPFNPATVKANETGDVSTNVTLNPDVLNGSYYIRFDYTGLFTFSIFEESFTLQMNGMTATSSRQTMVIWDPGQLTFAIYLNNTPNSVYDMTYNQGQVMNASVRVLMGGSPSVGTLVNFVIVDNRETATVPWALGSNSTNVDGWTEIKWVVNASCNTGPAVVRARFNDGQDHDVYAYCFINRSVILNISGIMPDATIDFQARGLGFIGSLNDSNNRPIMNALIQARIYDKGSNPSSVYSISPSAWAITDGNGNATWPTSSTTMDGTGDQGFYDLRCEFTGIYDFTGHPWYTASGLNPGFRGVAQAATNFSLKREIFITDSSQIDMCNFWVNGTVATANYNDMNIGVFNAGNVINFTAQCRVGGSFVNPGTVTFYDTTAGGSEIGSGATDTNGFATLLYQVPSPANWIAGPHEIAMTYRPNLGGSRSNYTVVLFNSTTRIESASTIPAEIVRGSTTVSISGNIYQGQTGNGVNRAVVNLTLYDVTGTTYLPGYINGPTTYVTGTTGYFSFSFTISTNLAPGSYKLRVQYNQVIDGSSFTHCPTYLTNKANLNASQSPFWNVAVNASVGISGASYTPERPFINDYFTVSGTFTWDNGTVLQSNYAGWITIKVTELGNPSNVLNVTTISSFELSGGSIAKSIQVTWDVDFEVTFVFAPTGAQVTYIAIDVPGVG